MDEKTQGTETDSVPRVTVPDLFMVLHVFDRSPETTLEEVRLRICVNRKQKYRGTGLWSAARDTSGELVKLGLIEGSPSARNAKHYETIKGNKLTLTADGRALITQFKAERKGAYAEVFKRMVAKHPYVRDFIRALDRGDIFAPVISSMKDHVAQKYGSHTGLSGDLAVGKFETKAFLATLVERLQRDLTADEEAEIVEKVREMVSGANRSAVLDDGTKLPKLILNRLNDIIIPAVFRSVGLGFDTRSHRALWSLGEDFKTWGTLRSHPQHPLWLIYRTAKIGLSEDGTQLARIDFEHGINQTGEDFLKKLFTAYQTLQSVRGGTFVQSWELRAVFCYENRCQMSVFDKLFDQWSAGSVEFKLRMEIQRQKPQHEEPVRVGKRNIGSVRVVKG